MASKVGLAALRAKRQRLITIGLARNSQPLAVSASFPTAAVSVAEEPEQSTGVLVNQLPPTKAASELSIVTPNNELPTVDSVDEISTIHLDNELPTLNSVKKIH